VIRRYPWIRIPFHLLGLGITLTAAAAAQTRVSDASNPWTVTLTPTLNPLPIAFCAAVRLDLVDPNTGQRPRNPAGYLMGFADFDLSVTSADPRAVVGQPIGTTGWNVCGCQAGTPGAVATITASYPAAALPAKLRAPGVAFQTTTTVTLATAKGRVDPPVCVAPLPPPVIVTATPLPPAPVARIAPGVPPTGVAVTGTPLIARLTWTAAPNATRYAVLRKDDAQAAVERSPPAFTATAFTDTLPDPRITYQYTVVAYYADGSQGSAPAVQYLSPPMLNPTGFTMTKKGQTSREAEMEFSWNAVPGAIRYRLDGAGIPDTGHYLTTTTASLNVPRGAGSWRVMAMYPGNHADIAGAATLAQVIRILPTPSEPWLTMRNGTGSLDEVQMPRMPMYHCAPLPPWGCIIEEHVPNQLQHPYEANYAAWVGRGLAMTLPVGLDVWLDMGWNRPGFAKVWDLPAQQVEEAVYGNSGDLGVGRRSFCAQKTRTAYLPGVYTVCYASAHGIAPGEPGFNDPSLITQPGTDQNRLLTMVITKEPTGSVFMVFAPLEPYTLSPTVTLDTQGEKHVPHACLSCHGGTYNPLTHKVDGASFLPIDPGLQLFANPAEKVAQQFKIRRINEIIAKSGSSPAVVAYINGLYGNAVQLPNQQATPDYVPAGWQAQAGLYRHVVRPYCAMCHLAAPSDLSFASWGNFQSNALRIKTAVCGLHTMPHSELQFKEFWLKDTGPLYLPGLLATTLGFPSC
jgi:hypothetical protein